MKINPITDLSSFKFLKIGPEHLKDDRNLQNSKVNPYNDYLLVKRSDMIPIFPCLEHNITTLMHFCQKEK